MSPLCPAGQHTTILGCDAALTALHRATEGMPVDSAEHVALERFLVSHRIPFE